MLAMSSPNLASISLLHEQPAVKCWMPQLLLLLADIIEASLRHAHCYLTSKSQTTCMAATAHGGFPGHYPQHLLL